MSFIVSIKVSAAMASPSPVAPTYCRAALRSPFTCRKPGTQGSQSGTPVIGSKPSTAR